MTLYVGNLSFQATPQAVTEFFAAYGEVTRVAVPIDRTTGRLRGFAFVEMANTHQEDAAIAALDGTEWMGRPLKLNKAKPRPATIS